MSILMQTLQKVVNEVSCDVPLWSKSKLGRMRCRWSLFSILIGFAAAVPLMLTLGSAGAAEPDTTELTVAVAILPPFVLRQNGQLTGFAIDLWNAVASRMKVKTNYQVTYGAPSLFDAVRFKRADVIGTPVVITEARDEEFDFSLPIIQAGLQIMVRDTGETPTQNPLADLLGLLFSKTMLLWLGIALVLILVPAHLVWLLERGRRDGMISNSKYIPGIFEAMYWAISGLTAQPQDMPHQWLARVFSVFWMFAGVVFVAFYTAQLTTALTVRQIQGAINGPDDLAGKRIGTLANSFAVDYLRSQNVQIQEFHEPGPLLQALQARNIDAVIYTAPVLMYYAAHEGKRLVKLVGPEFYLAPIAFGFQFGSPLVRKVNHALLALRENGTYQQLYHRWFGVP